MKKNLTSIFLPIIVFFITTSSVTKPFSDDFNFNQVFNTLEISKKIKLIRSQDSDFFLANLHTCKPSFYKDLIKSKTYYLSENKNQNNIALTEYIFKDSISAKKAFVIANDYANYIRNLERKNYAKKCYEIWDEQVYYARQRENHIYLFNTLDNIIFTEKNNSAEAFFNNSKEVLIDDFYNEFK